MARSSPRIASKRALTAPRTARSVRGWQKDRVCMAGLPTTQVICPVNRILALWGLPKKTSPFIPRFQIFKNLQFFRVILHYDVRMETLKSCCNLIIILTILLIVYW